MDLTVLSITGWCRSGSTILGNILNEVPGVVHVGELHFLWKNAYGNGSNTLCGCGLDLLACSIWSRVLKLELPPGRTGAEHGREVRRTQLSAVRTRHTWRVLRGRRSADEREYAATLARAYRAIAEVTGCKIIVDSGKMPGESALLSEVEGISPRYLHLVRDPRATAHSWGRQKDYAHIMSAWRSTAYWVGFNLASEAVLRRHPGRSLFLRYEDFIAQPSPKIDEILDLCGVDRAHNPMRGHTVELRPNHTVTGNPDRFRSGTTLIRPNDDAWRRELAPRDRAITECIAWPRMHRYGYDRPHQKEGGALGSRSRG